MEAQGPVPSLVGVNMRKVLLGLSLILSLEAAAIACSCVAPGTPKASRAAAREVVRNAVAVVEVDVLSEYRRGGQGELVRLRRTLFGTAPKAFRIQRGPFESDSSCFLPLRKGQRKVLILSKPTGNRIIGQRFQMQSLCSDYLTSDRGYLAVTLQEARRRRLSFAPLTHLPLTPMDRSDDEASMLQAIDGRNPHAGRLCRSE